MKEKNLYLYMMWLSTLLSMIITRMHNNALIPVLIRIFGKVEVLPMSMLSVWELLLPIWDWWWRTELSGIMKSGSVDVKRQTHRQEVSLHWICRIYCWSREKAIHWSGISLLTMGMMISAVSFWKKGVYLYLVINMCLRKERKSVWNVGVWNL